jgi:nucleoside-diphosphate-sugar epimerase
MRVLVIGGNRFVGRSLVWRLLYGGHRVTLVNRGRLADPFGDRVERIRADRATDEFDRALAGREFDGAVDFAGYTAEDAARSVHVLGGQVGHFVFVSTGQVYLVREGCPRPSRETDYDGPVMEAAPTPADHADWQYGIGKRGAEDVLAASPALPSTRLRIPIVHGELDYLRRIESYLWRMLDGGPLIVPRADSVTRHIYGGAVARAIARVLEAPPRPGQAFNLAQAEQPTVRELIERVAARAGARARIVEIAADEVEAAGLSVRDASPFSGRWASLLDPSRAVAELGFEHPPLDAYLDSTITGLLAAWPAEPPPGYAQRGQELALASSSTAGAHQYS